MKYRLLSFILVVGMFTVLHPKRGEAAELRAIKGNITALGPFGFDIESHKKFRKIVAELFNDVKISGHLGVFTIGKYTSIPFFEGGEFFCIELGGNEMVPVPVEKLDYVLARLKEISPDKTTTGYDLETMESCN